MNNPFEAKGLVNQHFWLYPSHKKRRKQKNFWSGFWRKFLMENKKDCCSWCSIYSHWVNHCRKLLLDDSWLFGPKDSHSFYLLNSTLVSVTPNYNYFFFLWRWTTRQKTWTKLYTMCFQGKCGFGQWDWGFSNLRQFLWDPGLPSEVKIAMFKKFFKNTIHKKDPDNGSGLILRAVVRSIQYPANTPNKTWWEVRHETDFPRTATD